MEEVPNYKSFFAGQDYIVPTITNKEVTYINFDNAASTSPFLRVMDKINEFSAIYSSIHRGSGFKSILTTDLYEQTRKMAMEFVQADADKNTAIFIKNSTEAINMIARLYQFCKDDIVISTWMEHHSNDLPWRKKVNVKYINIKPDGDLDLEQYRHMIHLYKGKIKLVTITAASNVTGYINPIYEIARIAHEAGAKILVDASQYIPHRPVNLKEDTDVEHIDFLVYTAHKIYAPFGTAVAIGPKDFFNQVDPDILGGGTVKIVTEEEVYFNDTPERNEGGTPNVMGSIALGTAIKQLQCLGYKRIMEHEKILTSYLLEGLIRIPGIKIYGEAKAEEEKRLSVVSFNLDHIPHGLVSAILAYEYGIGVRNGCFCAHTYVLKLLNLDSYAIKKLVSDILQEDRSHMPGLVRVSIGLQNNKDEIDRLLLALSNIANENFSDKYSLDTKTGVYSPIDWETKIEDYFQF